VNPLVVVIAGVAGTGKTSVGLLVASQLAWPFADGDSFHTGSSVAKMRSGTPLLFFLLLDALLAIRLVRFRECVTAYLSETIVRIHPSSPSSACGRP